MTRIAPGMPKAVLRPSNEVHHTSRGPEVQTQMTVPPDYFEQYRQGWRCPSCHSVQDEAFPEVCKTVWRDTGEPCGYRIREWLPNWLRLNFQGEESLWPDRTDEIEDLRERDYWTSKNGIVVPRSME